MNHSLSKRLVAEILGTGFLTVSVVGSAAMAHSMTDVPALVTLCVAISCSAALFVLLELLGPISGGHFNPVVTLAIAFQGHVRRSDAAFYVCMQVLGGALGVILVHVMLALPLLSSGVQSRTGFSIWAAEAISTFGLILTILLGLRFRPQSVSAFVGIYVLSLSLFASSSFANPATTIARALTNTFGGIEAVDVPAFIMAQILGCVVAVALCGWLAPTALKTEVR